MSNIRMLTDSELTAKLAPLKGEAYRKYTGQGICWRGIGDVLGISPQAFHRWASGKGIAGKSWSDTSREKVSEFLYRYERGEISLTRETGQWTIVFHGNPKPRDRLVSCVRMTPEGLKLEWVKQNDNEGMEMPDTRLF